MNLFRVSANVWFRWRDGQLLCDMADTHRQVALRPEAERLLRTFADWTPLESAGSADDIELARQMAATGLLEEKLPVDGASGTAWTRLGPSARHFHLATRTTADTKFLSSSESLQAIYDRGVALPPVFQAFPEKPHVPLPAALRNLPEMSLGDSLRARRSTRSFADVPMSTETLATILHWAAGPLHEVDMPRLGSALLKTSPSGGARHPMELFPVVRNVQGLSPGVYHYDARNHQLDLLRTGANGAEVSYWCGDQEYVADAAVVVFYAAALARSTWKYGGGRTYRVLLLDLGHLSQTVYLVATALGTGVLFTAALRDAPVENALGIDWQEQVVLAATALGIKDPAEVTRQEHMLSGGPVGFSRRSTRS